MNCICAECGKEWNTSRYHRLTGNQYICPICEERMWAKATGRKRKDHRKEGDKNGRL